MDNQPVDCPPCLPNIQQPAKKKSKTTHKSGPTDFTIGSVDTTKPQPQPAPRRKAFNGVMPPKRKVATGKKSKISPTTGLFIRVLDPVSGKKTIEIDHDGIKKLKLTNNCKHSCCADGSKFSVMDAHDQKELVKKIRTEARNSHAKGGNDGLNAYLCQSITRQIKLDVTNTHPFKTKDGEYETGKGICSYCRTLSNDELDFGENRSHRYSQNRCPNWQAGQDWIQINPPSHVKYYRNEIGEICRTFYMSLFAIGHDKLKKLNKLTQEGFTAANRSKQGSNGGHNKMKDQEIDDLSEIIKSQHLENSHYARFDSKSFGLCF